MMYLVVAIVLIVLIGIVTRKYSNSDIKLLKLRGIAVSSETEKRLLLCKAKGLDVLKFNKAIIKLNSLDVALMIDDYLDRFESGKDPIVVLEAMADLEMYIRHFEWDYLCAVEDCGVGAKRLRYVFYKAHHQSENLKYLEQLTPKNEYESSIIKFVKATALMFSNDFISARELFKESLKITENSEARFCYAETYLWENEERLNRNSIDSIFTILNPDKTHYSRMSDMILSQYSDDYNFERDFTLSEDHLEISDSLISWNQKIVNTKYDGTAGEDVYFSILSDLYHLKKEYRNALKYVEEAIRIEPSEEEYKSAKEILLSRVN